MKLTAENVNAVMKDCLYASEELECGAAPADAVIVDGIMNKFGFHPERLNKHRGDIASMLGGLPDSFKTSGGGGMSFLNACVTKDDVHWAEHPTMAALFALGMGIGAVSYPIPREMWSALPGSVPYLTVHSERLSPAA
jgi:hypothetical protein